MKKNSQFTLQNEIHLWCFSVDPPPGEQSELEAVLSTDEIQRSRQFHWEWDTNRFVARRGMLRCILSDYTGQAPQAIRFEYNAQGKPFLCQPHQSGAVPLFFSLSHSAGKAVCAVARGLEMGVDLERQRPLDGMTDIVRQYFAAAEKLEYNQVQDPLKPGMFFQWWTRKEAYIKARGLGLSLALDSFSVVDQHQALRVADPSVPGEYWTIMDLNLIPGYKAALAAPGSDWIVTRYDYQDKREKALKETV